jgi:hypothetical protein
LGVAAWEPGRRHGHDAPIASSPVPIPSDPRPLPITVWWSCGSVAVAASQPASRCGDGGSGGAAHPRGQQQRLGWAQDRAGSARRRRGRGAGREDPRPTCGDAHNAGPIDPQTLTAIFTVNVTVYSTTAFQPRYARRGATAGCEIGGGLGWLKLRRKFCASKTIVRPQTSALAVVVALTRT